MQDLANLWEEYKQAVRAGGDAVRLYRERVWPALLERWREDPPVHPAPQEFGLSIHTLGTSPEATALAILGTRAQRVYVLHTRETEAHLTRLREDTGKEVYPLEVGKSDVATIYRHVKSLLERFPKETPVALDLTSGTKAMSAGLAAAGFFFQRFYPNVRVVYVDNEEYDSELRRPRAGSERLILLPNPHEVLADLETFFAQEYYERGDYARAAKELGNLLGRTKDNQRYEPYKLLAEMYAHWHALDFQEAVRSGKALLRLLGKDAWLQHVLNQHRKVLEGQLALLEAASDFLKTQDLGNTRGVLGVVETLLRLSERWEDTFTVLAALHAYRALELVLQERLFTGFGKKADAPDLTEGEKTALRQELARILNIPESEVRLGARLGLLDLVALLRSLGDPVLLSLSVSQLQSLAGVLEARNKSLLVHGFNTASPGELKQILSTLQPLLKDLRGRGGIGVPLKPVGVSMLV
ncbi:MAG: TIGR02710 family CRISPR-associated CARF protein [Thermus sp.]|uniref:TIGR02710 family CRISPR-associated CARF protein n=1 Tax=Thermus sp. TaxID=275 RepID=UPI00391C2E68